MHHPTDRIAHTTAFVTPVVEHWLEREIEQHRTLILAYIGFGLRYTLPEDRVSVHGFLPEHVIIIRSKEILLPGSYYPSHDYKNY